jgi:alpha-L-fucosidase
MHRRRFLKLLAASAVASTAHAEDNKYVRANTDWLAECRYGVGVHWTAQTVPRKGPAVQFHKAVDSFDVKKFVDTVVYAGADYVLFTATHAVQMLPAPNPAIDGISPGRTCTRDLLKELADRLATKGVHFLVYYNHSCNSKDDPPWENVVGYHDKDKGRLVENLCDIVGWMSKHYGESVKAWWFDSPYSLDIRGPYNSVTTDMTGFQFPWERFTRIAKQGYAERLVTYNPGIHKTFLYTTHQDYWAGEMANLKNPARSRYLDNGLQWFGWTCLDDRRWVHRRLDTPIPEPRYPVEEIVNYVRACNSVKAPMTFNVGVYQDGTMAPKSVEQLRLVGKKL